MIDETLFGGFPRGVKTDIYNGVSETLAFAAPSPSPPPLPRGFDINVTRQSFEFMNHSRFHKAQLGTPKTFLRTRSAGKRYKPEIVFVSQVETHLLHVRCYMAVLESD